MKELKKNCNDRRSIGVQTKRKELTKTLMAILNWKKPFDLHGLEKYMSAL